jgi:small subunit ribosomal protein S16
MLKIRLSRAGRKKLPFYHLVVAENTSPRDGKFIEKVGTYNPFIEENKITIKKDRVEHWLAVGAVPTDRVSIFLNDLAVKGAQKYKVKFTPKKKGEGSKKKEKK